MLDHHLVQPRFHAGIRFAALTVPAVVPLDAPAMPPQPISYLPSCRAELLRRAEDESNLAPFDTVEDDVLRFVREIPPRLLE
jgi:hypothetical protein